MMRFSRILRFDLIHGFKTTWKVFLCEIVLAILVAYDFCMRSMLLQETEGIPRTLGDFWLYAFGGMKEYIPSPYEPFLFPTLWMLFFSLLCFSTLWYPFEDLHGFGTHILTLSQRREKWYLSKCMWCWFTVSVSFVLIGVVFFVSCLITDSTLSFNVSSYMGVFFELASTISIPQGSTLIYPIVIGPWFTAIMLSSLQLVVSLCLHPIIGFCISEIVLLSSAYYFSPIFPGNYGMIIRNECFVAGGMSSGTGFSYLLIVCISSIGIGMYLFRRYDIIKKGSLR